MIVTAQQTPIRFQKVFTCRTFLIFQIRGPQVITLTREQGESQTANDGIQISQASTAPPNLPFKTWWQGELWYISDIPNGTFNLIISTETGVG